MQLIPRKTKARLSAELIGLEGEALEEPTDPKVTITRDSDGVVIVDAEAVVMDEARATYVLDEPIVDVDLLLCEWECEEGSLSSQVGVVGGFLCSLEAITAELAKQAATAITDPFTLRKGREHAEQFLEDQCGVALRPRYTREKTVGDGDYSLLLAEPRVTRIISATAGEEAIELDELAIDEGGAVVRGGGRWTQAIDIAYEHGFTTPPAGAERAAVKLAAHILRKRVSDHNDRATRIETENASYGFMITAGQGGAPTSLPEVNAFIEDNRYMTVG